jgi:hypothetical protein
VLIGRLWAWIGIAVGLVAMFLVVVGIAALIGGGARKWTPVAVTLAGMGAGTVLVILGGFWRSISAKTLLTDRAFFFTLSVVYLILLTAVLWMYLADYYGIKDTIPPMVGGILPLAVPWFGAVGAVVISLEGVYQHFDDWNRSYGYWHMSRPLFGAVLGSVAYFIFFLLVKASGTDSALPTSRTPASNLVVYWVVAFIVRYREETFRALVKAVADVILKPANVVPLQDPSIRGHWSKTIELLFWRRATGRQLRRRSKDIQYGDGSASRMQRAHRASR